MDLNLKGKVALVTGGSHGIGQAICISLAQEGCNIAYCARGERYYVHDTENFILELGVSCLASKIDVNTEVGVDLVVANAIKIYGRVDILVNNVGGGSGWGNTKNWENTPTNTWKEVIDINYMTTIWFTNKVLPYMIQNKFGRIISIASVYGKENGGTPWFQAAKSAQISLMKSYSGNKSYAENGITFNTICPGFITIPPDKLMDVMYLPDIPIGRFGKPIDVSPIVTLLCSDKSGYINGACITVDGGYTKSF